MLHKILDNKCRPIQWCPNSTRELYFLRGTRIAFMLGLERMHGAVLVQKLQACSFCLGSGLEIYSASRDTMTPRFRYLIWTNPVCVYPRIVYAVFALSQNFRVCKLFTDIRPVFSCMHSGWQSQLKPTSNHDQKMQRQGWSGKTKARARPTGKKRYFFQSTGMQCIEDWLAVEVLSVNAGIRTSSVGCERVKGRRARAVHVAWFVWMPYAWKIGEFSVTLKKESKIFVPTMLEKFVGAWMHLQILVTPQGICRLTKRMRYCGLGFLSHPPSTPDKDWKWFFFRLVAKWVGHW